MNKLGVQSCGTIDPKEPEQGYRMIKEAGFDCVDFNFDEYLSCGLVQSGKEEELGDLFDRPMEEIWQDFAPHVKLAERYGLTFEQMHAPFPMVQPGKEAVNEKMFRITANSIELCGRMGGKYIVVHPVTLAYAYSREDEHDVNMEMYRRLIPVAGKSRVVICLENMFVDQRSHLMEGCCSDFREAADWIDELNGYAGKEQFGFCLDVGHANILGKNLYQTVLTLGDRLKILHIHDNDGVSDLHTMPYTFMRGWNGLSTGWDGFLRGLRQIGYKGVLNFETFRCMQGFPRELHPAVLKLLAATGAFFRGQI